MKRIAPRRSGSCGSSARKVLAGIVTIGGLVPARTGAASRRPEVRSCCRRSQAPAPDLSAGSPSHPPRAAPLPPRDREQNARPPLSARGHGAPRRPGRRKRGDAQPGSAVRELRQGSLRARRAPDLRQTRWPRRSTGGPSGGTAPSGSSSVASATGRSAMAATRRRSPSETAGRLTQRGLAGFLGQAARHRSRGTLVGSRKDNIDRHGGHSAGAGDIDHAGDQPAPPRPGPIACRLSRSMSTTTTCATLTAERLPAERKGQVEHRLARATRKRSGSSKSDTRSVATARSPAVAAGGSRASIIDRQTCQ